MSAIVTFLTDYPGPTDNQIKRWKTIRIFMVLLCVPYYYLVWYVLYADNPDQLLRILDPLVEVIMVSVPAAQGYTNRSFLLREQMPYLYSIWFLFVCIILTLTIFFSTRFPSDKHNYIHDYGLGKFLFYAILFLFISTFFLYFLFFGGSSKPAVGPRTGSLPSSYLFEKNGHAFFITTTAFYFLSYYLGEMIAVLRRAFLGYFKKARVLK